MKILVVITEMLFLSIKKGNRVIVENILVVFPDQTRKEISMNTIFEIVLHPA